MRVHSWKSIIYLCQRNIILHAQYNKKNIKNMVIYHQNTYLMVIFY